MSTTNTINWAAAERVAERLGVRTRELVAAKDPEAVQEWALQMSRAHDGSGYNAQRSASYIELAVLVGHHEQEGHPDE
jgi:hypothetical protein